jgi:hypothetical protein
MNARLTSFEASYGHTLPSDAGRELPEKGRTADLRSVTVEVVVEDDNNDRSGFEFTYHADHEESGLTLATAEPQYDDHAPVPELSEAAELADDAVHAWVLDVGKDLRIENRLTSAGVRGRADVYTDLKVDA